MVNVTIYIYIAAPWILWDCRLSMFIFTSIRGSSGEGFWGGVFFQPGSSGEIGDGLLLSLP